MKILVRPKFEKQLNKLPNNIQDLICEKEVLFCKDPFNPKLKTHKLKGKMDGFWSFSINYDYRIIFEFFENDKALFYLIGNHKIYK